MMHETVEVATEIVNHIKEAAPDLFGKNQYYDQMIAAAHLGEYADQFKDVVANEATLKGVNFSFLGIDLGAIPNWKFWKWDFADKSQIWPTVGGVLMALLSCGSQVLSMVVSQRMNNSLITDEKGLQDKDTAKKSQAAQSGKLMMWMMPLMSLWIGFTIPAALSLYWFAQGIVALVIDVILTNRYRKIYDAEDAARLAKALEQEKLEAEKERLRAERRAANPDGITQNTSKKKLQQQQLREQEAAKAAAKREYDAKKGILVEEVETEGKPALSGITDRPNAKGRAYDPNRYATENTEE
jgi:YidC/Oxa1 family membrane protein insertase